MHDVRTANWPQLLWSAKAARTEDPPISALMSMAMDDPAIINFAAGFVDPLTLPVDECLEIARRVLSDRQRGRMALQYDTTIGLKALREEALRHIESLEGMPASSMAVGPEHMVITNGSQQALYLIAEVLIDPGDIVIAANPSYFVYTGTLRSFGARVIAVPADNDGLDVDAAASALDRLDAQGLLNRVKFIYVNSYFDNPTGCTLSAERRRRLLEIVSRYARRQRILIVEDAAYRELRYDGDDLPSIKSMDRHNLLTVLTQTFSKPFAPGLKLGYTLMPADLAGAVLRQKGNHDFGTSALCQHMALEALRDGSYARHVHMLRREYRRKRDAMLAALKRHMPAGCRWTRPAGGLYVWLELPQTVNTSRAGGVFDSAVRRGVLYVPGECCFQPDESGHIPRHHMRLNFGQVDIDSIDEGVRRLSGVVGEALAACPQRAGSATS